MSDDRARYEFEQLPPEHRLGDAPVQSGAYEFLTTTIRTLNKLLNGDVPPSKRKWGIVLLVFPYGDTSGRCNYVSNGANREDMVTLLREQANRFEEDTKR